MTPAKPRLTIAPVAGGAGRRSREPAGPVTSEELGASALNEKAVQVERDGDIARP